MTGGTIATAGEGAGSCAEANDDAIIAAHPVKIAAEKAGLITRAQSIGVKEGGARTAMAGTTSRKDADGSCRSATEHLRQVGAASERPDPAMCRSGGSILPVPERAMRSVGVLLNPSSPGLVVSRSARKCG
jgi:hypothetical protein